MKQYNSNYLGLVVNNNDPEYRGRVQVFVPHIMPALYEGWNKDGEDINISCIGDNLQDSLNSEIVSRLQKILPWAEAASPIIGSSSPGGVVQAVGEAIDSFVGGVKNFFNQSPTATPTKTGILGTDIANAATSNLNFSTANLPGTDGGNLGCAAAVSKIFKDGTGQDIIPGKSVVLSTRELYGHMSTSKDWVQVPKDQIQPGDILVTATGKTAGHTGIYTGVGPNTITSNSSSGFMGSARGTIQANYNLQTWEKVEARNPQQSGVFRYVGPGSANSVDPTTLTQTSNPSPEESNSSGIPPQPNFLVKPDGPQGSEPQAATAPTTTIQLGGPEAGISGTISGKQTISDANTTIADAIFASEARLDKDGNLKVYSLPSNDGGGSYEVAGINERYHPGAASKLKNLIDSGQQDQAKAFAKSYIMNYTKTAVKISANAGTEYALRDITFNRGPGGANWMAQKAAGLQPSLKMSPDAQAAILEAQRQNPKEFLQKLKTAATEYENTQVGYRSNLAKGLEKRFNDRLENSLAILDGNVPMTPSNSVNDYGTDLGFESPSVVNNTFGHGRTIQKNTNDMAKGLFAFPNVGAMVWVFFREGNPLYPVYFAASYSSSEWQSAYRGSSVNASGTNTGNPSPTEISNSAQMNFNSAGGIEATEVINTTDPTKTKKVLMVHGPDGSNRAFTPGFAQDYIKGNFLQHVDSNSFRITHGYEEKWVEADSNCNIRGNHIIKVGKFDQEALDAMKALSDISYEINQSLKSS